MWLAPVLIFCISPLLRRANSSCVLFLKRAGIFSWCVFGSSSPTPLLTCELEYKCFRLLYCSSLISLLCEPLDQPRPFLHLNSANSYFSQLINLKGVWGLGFGVWGLGFG